jgi:hypothetical protein
MPGTRKTVGEEYATQLLRLGNARMSSELSPIVAIPNASPQLRAALKAVVKACP